MVGKRPLFGGHGQKNRDKTKARQRQSAMLGLAVLLSIYWLFGGMDSLFTASQSPKKLNIVGIPRVQAGSLSPKEFFQKFSEVPVIIEGEVKHHRAYNMSLDALKQVCGKSTVETMVYDKNSKSWGGLVDRKYMRLNEYVDNHLLSGREEELPDAEPRYLTAGIGLPQTCPRLATLTPVPKYVSLSIYPIDPSHYKQSRGKRNMLVMPVMFIGNKGTKTEMHVDRMLGPFWMSVYRGRKSFRVVTYWDASKHWGLNKKRNKDKPGNWLLYHGRWSRERKPGVSTKDSRGVDQMEIWNPDLEAFPDLSKVTVYEGAVNAGDWIYLPSASLHGVRNDEISWGITVNSLYPEVINQQAEICADSGGMLGCALYTNFSLSECDYQVLEKNRAKASSGSFLSKYRLKKLLQECMSTRSSTLVEHLKKEWEEGPKEMYLHEIAGYSDYESWCKSQCSMYKLRYMKENEGLSNVMSQVFDESCSQCSKADL